MQVLRVKQVLPALPPLSHGGSIDARALVSKGTQWFLENPASSLVDDPPKNVKLQAKVHVVPGEAKQLFQLLVERKILCLG